MKTKEEILDAAENIHFAMMDVEETIEELEKQGKKADKLEDTHFEMTLDLAYLMRDLVDIKFTEEYEAEQKLKVYHEIPGATDFYSGKVGTVEVDPEIAEAVRIFNEKGYTTKASCAGHTNKKDSIKYYGYVAFYVKPSLRKLPKGLINDKGVLRWHPRSENGLIKARTTLLAFAKSLKPKNLDSTRITP
jgi:hypothetical protein